MSYRIPAETLGQLREDVIALRGTPMYNDIVEPRDKVFARFQPVFSLEHLESITEDEFRSFLLAENNRHWSGLHRQGSRICADMGKLRKALTILTDESQPLALRLDRSVEMISGMGKNVASAILLITQPDKYGVWNNRSEAVMKRLRIWPEFEKGESFGSRYNTVNGILLHLCEELKIDLWTLDALWWYLDQFKSPADGQDGDTERPLHPAAIDSDQRFGLERHLHEFLLDNWEKTELGKEWTLYQEPGDKEAGYEYPCEVGRIDLLARHRSDASWLVIELKRNQTSDQTVGQLLRYVGWVKANLASPKEEVHGMIICRDGDNALHYAVSAVPNVSVRTYQVEFRLHMPKKI